MPAFGSVPTKSKDFYHLFNDGERWVLLGHGNDRATAVEESFTDIKSRVQELLSGTGSAFAVIHWEYSPSRSNWRVKRIGFNRRIKLDGRSSPAVVAGDFL